MTAIAEWWVLGGFAHAEIERLFLWHFEFECLESGAFVRAITEWLVRTATTGTPPMGACFNFECEGFGTAYNWFFCHASRLAVSIDLSIILRTRIAGEQIA